MSRRFLLLLLCAGLLCGGAGLAAEAPRKEKWAGIDEAVIEKYAVEKGRPEARPLFDVEGDLLLFLFAVAGAAGGFVMGFYWHKVFVAGKRDGRGNL